MGVMNAAGEFLCRGGLRGPQAPAAPAIRGIWVRLGLTGVCKVELASGDFRGIFKKMKNLKKKIHGKSSTVISYSVSSSRKLGPPVRDTHFPWVGANRHLFTTNVSSHLTLGPFLRL